MPGAGCCCATIEVQLSQLLLMHALMMMMDLVEDDYDQMELYEGDVLNGDVDC